MCVKDFTDVSLACEVTDEDDDQNDQDAMIVFFKVQWLKFIRKSKRFEGIYVPSEKELCFQF